MRLQLALNVTDLDAAIDFYSKMFDTSPAKTKPGYANFAIENPPLKLVLFQVDGAHPEAATGGDFHHLNHLGVEVEILISREHEQIRAVVGRQIRRSPGGADIQRVGVYLNWRKPIPPPGQATAAAVHEWNIRRYEFTGRIEQSNSVRWVLA